jgi:hypothetical protein
MYDDTGVNSKVYSFGIQFIVEDKLLMHVR